MKTKLSLVLLLSFIFGLLSSQVPQGFNYQAVARNASGAPVANQLLPVRMTIMSDSLGGTILWQELHSSVTTNLQGVFNLVVGKGVRESASTVTTFSNIDWTVTPKFLKTEINYSGWKTLGVSRLWSVPYAQVARDLDGPVRKLSVEGETSGLEEALFEVKNRDGQTVFAVYNEGVRVYVSDGAKALKGGFAVGGFGTDKAESTKYLFVGKDSVRIYLDTNPLTKGLKSGFAVGGYDVTKGTVQNYLDVSADSIRVYIDDTGSGKGRKGGFAVGGFDMTKGSNKSFLNVEIDTLGKINPSENRILWYPLKNAFITGKVLVEDKDSVGVNSFASGYESKAKGNWSQALGYKAIARGDYSTAIGRNALAVGQFSFAFGESAVADGIGNYAYGSAEIDTVTGLTIPGTFTKASGTNSIAFGLGAKTMNGSGNIAIGMASEASGERFALAIGERARATNYRTISIGHWGSYGIPPFLMLYQKPNLASGSSSIAIGYGNTSSGNGTMTMGTGNTASEANSIAFGRINRTYGQGSVALGYHLYVYSYMATAIGRWNTDNGTTDSWVSSDPLFMIGNGYQLGGSSIIRRNAVTVLKSGAVGIGVNPPAYTLDVNGEITSRSYNGLRIRGTNYSTIIRNDGADFYLLATLSGDPDGTWSTLRPFSFNLANGTTYLGGQALTVIHGGNVGIGTTSPGTKLSIAGLTGTTAGSYLRIYNNDVYYYSSSIKTKTDIEPLHEDFYKILNASPVSFTDKVSGERNIGFIAEDFDKIGLSNLVIYQDGEPVSLSYELISLYNLQIIKDQQKAIKEQQQQIESQNQKIDQLIVLIDELKKEIVSSSRH